MLANVALAFAIIVFIATVAIAVFVWRRSDEVSSARHANERRDSELRELVDMLAHYLADERQQVPVDLRNNSHLKEILSIRGARRNSPTRATVSNISQRYRDTRNAVVQDLLGRSS